MSTLLQEENPLSPFSTLSSTLLLHSILPSSRPICSRNIQSMFTLPPSLYPSASSLCSIKPPQIVNNTKRRISHCDFSPPFFFHFYSSVLDYFYICKMSTVICGMTETFWIRCCCTGHRHSSSDCHSYLGII